MSLAHIDKRDIEVLWGWGIICRGLFGWMGEGHFAGGAVAVDVEQGGACLQIEVAGQAVGVGALEAGAELAADAVSGVHEWG